MSGVLYGLGVGPGDPELLTLKALRILRAVPVVAYPAPLDGESLARRIAAAHMPGGQEEIAVRLPFDPGRGDTDVRYDRAAAELGDHLAAGRDVAFLCLGDPLFYGTFANLCERVAERFPVEVVPGVSSLSAAAAVLRRPLGLRNEVMAVVPATLGEEELAARIGGADTAAVIKLGRHLPKVRRLLARLGLTAAARYVEQVGLGSQRVCALDEVKDGEASYFSLLLVRKEGIER